MLKICRLNYINVQNLCCILVHGSYHSRKEFIYKNKIKFWPLYQPGFMLIQREMCIRNYVSRLLIKYVSQAAMIVQQQRRPLGII